MSEEKKENGSKKPDTGFRWVIPFFVVLIRLNADNLVLLSNTTFLKKSVIVQRNLE